MRGYDENKIKSRLFGPALNIELLCFDELDSTNTLAKEIAKKNKDKKTYVIIANKQSAGRGTKGRSFISREGMGLYMSILFYPDTSHTPGEITTYSAVRVCEAIEALTPLKAEIKWVNDIYVSKRKLCGILTEGKMNDSKLDYAIVGIGINTHGCRLPDEISDIATTIERECGLEPERELLASQIINAFLNQTSKIGTGGTMDEYRRRSMLTGREACVDCGGERFFATVLEILDNGAVLVEKENGERLELSSADVSVRPS